MSWGAVTSAGRAKKDGGSVGLVLVAMGVASEIRRCHRQSFLTHFAASLSPNEAAPRQSAQALPRSPIFSKSMPRLT